MAYPMIPLPTFAECRQKPIFEAHDEETAEDSEDSDVTGDDTGDDTSHSDTGDEQAQ